MRAKVIWSVQLLLVGRYALGLKWMGRFEEALAEIRVAQEIDPLSVMYRINEGEIYYNRRDYDRAIQHYRRAIERDPTEDTRARIREAIERRYTLPA